MVGWRFVRASCLPDAEAAEGDALVELDAVADLGGLADHDAGAVVDAEARPMTAPGWMSMPVIGRARAP
jgi:hypothetical protein